MDEDQFVHHKTKTRRTVKEKPNERKTEIEKEKEKERERCLPMTRLPGRYDNRYLGLPNHVSSIGCMISFVHPKKQKKTTLKEKQKKKERQKEKERESRQPMTRLGSRYDIGT
jgi:heme exporter protein D